MPLVEGAKSPFACRVTDKSTKSEVVKTFSQKDVLSAEDIKQSKDRINALRNSLQTKTQISLETKEPNITKAFKELNECAEEEKEKCDGSDTESLQDDVLSSSSSVVHSGIASYEIPYQSSSPRLNSSSQDENNLCSRPNIACNRGYQPTEISKGRFRALKERYQTSVNNLTYEGFDFEEKNTNYPSSRIAEKSKNVGSRLDKSKKHYAKINKELTVGGIPLVNPHDNLIYKIKSEIDNLEAETKADSKTNVIVGNKDILKLLSNKHLANLNIRVERGPDLRKEGLTDNRWREGLSSFRNSKIGVRSSIRSSKRKRKCKYRANIIYPSSEEKGTSDSTLKENESESDDELRKRLLEDKHLCDSEKGSAEEYSKKKFPEYAKVNKRKGGIINNYNSEIPPRSMSTSPIERAPVVKKICSSGVRLKKDSEPSLTANPVKKADSFRGSRVTRRNSFLYNTKGKTSREGVEHESFVKTQAVRLRRRSSKNVKKSEYRVSVTIRPSTVANLTNKFNTIIHQNQTENASQQNEVALGNVSLMETKVPKYYSSPKASFKRKYRHKAARALKEAKERERCNSDVDVSLDDNAIDNTIYYSENLSKRKSLNNSLSELNMKDLFDDCDYNKTDEEKVCEKLKTALSSGKFKGETDDSEDDLSAKVVTTEDLVADSASIGDEFNLESNTSALSELISEQESEVNVCEETSDNISTECNIFEKDNSATTKSEKNTVEIKDNCSEDLRKNVLDSKSVVNDPQILNKDSPLDCNDETEENDEKTISVIKKETSVLDLNEDISKSKEEINEVLKLDEISEAFSTSMCVDNLIYGKTDDMHKEETDVDNTCDQKGNQISACTKDETENSPREEIPEENPRNMAQESVNSKRKDGKVYDDIYSDCSSVAEDTYSEVSSIYSDPKSKKSKGEMRIYTSLKAVVKNTVKKTKEKDNERKSCDKISVKRSPSRDRDKWFKRNKSKERISVDFSERSSGKSSDKSKGKSSSSGGESSEKCKDSLVKEKKGKEVSRLYEKWNFKRFKEKSEDKHKNKDSEKKMKEEDIMKLSKDKQTTSADSEVEKNSVKLDQEKDPENLEQDESAHELYGKLKIACRSRSREKRIAKEQGAKSKKITIPENLPEKSIKNVSEIKKDSDNGDSQVSSKMEEISHCNVSNVSQEEGDAKESSHKEISIYEPHSPNGVKIIPPPPKTPIPSPPTQFRRFLFKHRPRVSSKKETNKNNGTESRNVEKTNENSENIYENIYSPDVETLKKNREKLEEEGIRPITSFLWSESAVLSTKAATLSKFKTLNDDILMEQTVKDYSKRRCSLDNQESVIKDSDEHSVCYDKIGSPTVSKKPIEDSNSEGNNYTEIQNGSSSDSQTVSYDDIGAPSAVSYDEIAAPSSCGYDDVRPPSSQGYDPFKSPSEGYDPVNPPNSDSSQYDDCDVELTVVKEAGYVYDDVSMYNASQMSHSYEPVCPPDDSSRAQYSVPVISEAPEREHSNSESQVTRKQLIENEAEELIYGSDESEYGPHQVCSYKLTRIGMKNNTNSSDVISNSEPENEVKLSSLRKTSLIKPDDIQRKPRNSELRFIPKGGESSKDVWEDVSDSEEEADIPVTLTARVPIKRNRPKRAPRYRVTKKSWTQGVRDVARAHNARIHSHTQSLASTLARVNPHAHRKAQITPVKDNPTYGETDHVITCSWRQKRAESDSDCQSPGHYEAIYEVINPTDDDDVTPSEEQRASESKHKDEASDDLNKESYPEDFDAHPEEDDDADDSFDSDESDEAYSRLRPLYMEPKSFSIRHEGISTLPAGSCAEDKYLRRKYNRSYSHQPHSINKIAEAANLGMKRLRRNWSLTKNEVRTGLNRIKKKSTFSMSDMKNSEDILTEVNPSSGDKSKWSLKSHFKRKSSAASLHASTVVPTEESQSKDNATFYLTLTIDSNAQEGEEGTEGGAEHALRERRKSMTPSISSVATTASYETTTSTKATGRPLSTPGTSLYRNSSSGSNSGTLFRPTNPPPAPPTGGGNFSNEDEDSSTDISKDKLASRLNQILSSGPVAPPGRRVLKTSETTYSSSDVSPIPLLPTSEDTKSHQKYYSGTSLKGASSLRQLLPEGVSNIPQTRSSVASSSSHGSSEGYIRPGDIASSPPPLPARPSTSSYPGNKRASALSLIGPLNAPSPSVPTSRSSDVDSRSYLDLTSDLGQEEPPYVSSHFADEPLYQFYTAKVERAALYQGDSSEDDYEVINDGGLNVSTPKMSTRPSAMELVTPTDGRRTLWCELPEVDSSGILNKISSQERKLQEAMFEVITSEASYLKSLEVLVTHFMSCEDFSPKGDDHPPVLSSRDKNVLFSDIIPVKKCSELFLGDLEKRWQESFLISGITDIIRSHAESSFNVYVKYCSNQIYQDRKLRNLKENNPRFVEVLSRLESSPVCQSLSMQSFLMLPMQRVTRLPLLVDAVFNRLEYGSSQWQECKVALASLQKIVAECNEAARKMERMEEMLLISHQLDFREVKAIPLISASRWLVKKGELTRLTWREGDAKLTFGRKISKHSLYFFLFTDLLVVTKKKSDDQHMVLDYCPRNMVQVLELENADKFPGRILDGHKNLIIMTMLQNHENKTVEMVLSCPLESDRSRWMEAVTPRISENPDERIYEEWDCPQVQAIHAYTSTQPDELTLEVSDVFNVLKKTSDGWYQGERLRDGARGWFPGNHTAEIASAHVRARNLRQRYRLLAISGSIVDELKKEKERFEKEEKKKDRRRTITIKEVL